MVKSETNSLKDTFNATGVAFEGQSATVETAMVDIRAKSKAQEQAQQKAQDTLDNNFARRTPNEGEEIGAPGRIATNQAQAKAQAILQKQKKEKELTRFLNRLQEQRIELERQINWTIKYFEQKAEEAEIQAGELRQKIIDNTERMIENSDFIRDVEKLLKADKDGISIDKEKLKKLLNDRGADIDDSTPLPLLLKTAEKMVVKADEENALLEVDNDIHDKNASKWEQKTQAYKTQARELQTKFDALKAQNLSNEEYNQQANKILEGVSEEVKNEYENSYGDNAMDEIAKEDLKSVEKKEVSLNPMEMMGVKPQVQTANKVNETNIHSPAPNGR